MESLLVTPHSSSAAVAQLNFEGTRMQQHVIWLALSISKHT